MSINTLNHHLQSAKRHYQGTTKCLINCQTLAPLISTIASKLAVELRNLTVPLPWGWPPSLTHSRLFSSSCSASPNRRTESDELPGIAGAQGTEGCRIEVDSLRFGVVRVLHRWFLGGLRLETRVELVEHGEHGPCLSPVSHRGLGAG